MVKPPSVIAILDDNESVGKALKRMLRSLPYEIQVFTSVKKFLEAFADKNPQLLILDLQMPEMDGLELQQLLRKQNRNFPIVFITARDDEEFRQRAMAAGAMDFLTKPFEKEVVLSLVRKALSQTQQQKPQLRLVGRLTDGLRRLTRPQLVGDDATDYELRDLLPCPFCGSYPRLDKGRYIDNSGRERYYARVVCPRCGGMLGTDRDDNFPSLSAAASEIVRRWNLRNRK